MLKKILTGTLAVMALALTFSLAPQPAEARLVCHDTWRGTRCVHVYPRYHHVRYVPWHRHHYWYHGYWR